MRVSTRLLQGVLLAALAVSCSSTEGTGVATPARSGGTSGAETDNTPLPEDELARRGHQVFDAACANCHREGSSAPAVANLRLSRQRMDGVLHAGSERGDLMPVLRPGTMTNEDVPALLAYLRTIHAVTE